VWGGKERKEEKMKILKQKKKTKEMKKKLPFLLLPLLARQLHVQRRQANQKPLQRRQGTPDVHAERVLARLAEL